MRKSLLLGFLALSVLGGCSDNAAPVMSPLSDGVALVNTEFTLGLAATDADGDPLTFSFASDLPDLQNRATLTDLEPGRALFRWTPLATDGGVHPFDFSVSDGENVTTETISIDVQVSGGEGSGAPIFVQPLGTGTTLDLRNETCVDVPITIEDPDSADVQIGQEAPLIDGASLMEGSDLAGSWNWCPTEEQIAVDDRYTLTLSADDGSSKTIKNYLIVLRSDSKSDCPGEAPVVTHTPEDMNTVVDVTVTAQISDDKGLKYEPLLYYATKDPGDTPDITQMTQLTMVLLDGDMKSGTWGADIPNPVAGQAVGAQAGLWYVISAKDDDDESGTCDHLTEAPSTGAYTMTVENPGGTGNLGLCTDCTADVQCGGEGDNCLFLDGDHHCFQQCADDTDCPDEYYCSFSAFTSIDGAESRQCLPVDYKCADLPAPSSCMDDAHEDDDDPDQAAAKGPIDVGTTQHVSCPADATQDDEDWFEIDVSSEGTVELSVTGGMATDLDLALLDSTGAIVESSTSLESTESLTACLSPGTYYARVYSWGTVENSYSLTYNQTSGSCAVCMDDAGEDDDDAVTARFADLNSGPYISTTNAICGDDDDWFMVQMFQGETLYATLTFDQQNTDQDLDVYIYDADGLNLTGCNEAQPAGCDPMNGQSGTSNESLVWPITESGSYYVVVHGWFDSENLYDICISYQEGDCPP